MKLDRRRLHSFLIITFIYIVAAAAGIVLFHFLSGQFWLRLLIADVVSTVIVYVFSCVFDNASVYDPYWSVQPIVIILALAFTNELNPVRILLIFVICLWGIRLTANWAVNFYGLGYEDWRYRLYKKRFPRVYPLLNFVGIHMVPTLIVYGCTLPAAYAFINDTYFSTWVIVFLLLSLGGISLEFFSDMQMRDFREDVAAGFAEGFCRRGLWKYSRHPNYLGEILMWWGIGFSVVSVMGDKWYLLAGALANTILFLTVSIPLAEGKQKEKEGFDAYRMKTHVLLPIPTTFKR
ncbi:MAG: DUF1295 domain-containing protein [Lachnospiraceae bacterium]|nr:DUF1295 domain-containing protein [Lachnospiraceae bacterium]